MLTFDKLKFVTSIDYITDVNLKKFNTIIKDGEITSYKYQQTSPYLLYVEKDIVDDELIIELTGKVLGANYPKLISNDTLRDGLDNINTLGICRLETDKILNDAKVVKADVTRDVNYSDISALTKELQSCIKSNQRYTVENRNGNFIVEKNVKTNNRKVRLTIYDKEKEMSLADNQRWVESFGKDVVEKMNLYFKGKVRFELNLNSIKAIKDMLSIKDTSLQSVLNAAANPIMSFLDKILVDNAEARISKSVRDLERLAFMKEREYDMKAIEQAIITLKSPKTNLSQVMKPYHLLYNALQQTGSDSIKERLRNLLLEIFLIGFFVSL